MSAAEILYLIFINHHLCPLHLDEAVLVGCQQLGGGLLHPASLTQELRHFTLGRVFFRTLQEYR